MTPGRNSVLIDLDKKERGTRLWQRIVLIGIGTALAAAALLAQQRGGNEPEPAPTATPTPTGAYLYPRTQVASLKLPTGMADVDLSAFPDWLANEPPAASLRAVVAVRGHAGHRIGRGPDGRSRRHAALT